MESLQSILLRFYIRQLLFSSVCSTVAALLFGTTFLTSEHLDTSFIVLYVSLIITAVFAALSLTLFFNVLEAIRKRILLSAIVWIGPPTLLLTYVISLIPEMIGFMATIPYLLGLLVAFWRFRTTLAKSKRRALEIMIKENRKFNNGITLDSSPWA